MQISKLFLLFVLMAIPASLLLAERGFCEQTTGVRTQLTADRMEYDFEINTVTFQGNVFVTRPDFKISAQTITIVLAEEDGAEVNGTEEIPTLESGRVKTITAKGGVRIMRDEKIGMSEKAVFEADKGVFTMSGDPELRDGDNTLKGEVIRIYLEDNRSEIVGDPGSRVEAIFFTPETPEDFTK